MVLTADGTHDLDYYIAETIVNNGGQVPNISNYVTYPRGANMDTLANAIRKAVTIIRRNDPPEFRAFVHPAQYDDAYSFFFADAESDGDALPCRPLPHRHRRHHRRSQATPRRRPCYRNDPPEFRRHRSSRHSTLTPTPSGSATPSATVTPSPLVTPTPSASPTSPLTSAPTATLPPTDTADASTEVDPFALFLIFGLCFVLAFIAMQIGDLWKQIK